MGDNKRKPNYKSAKNPRKLDDKDILNHGEKGTTKGVDLMRAAIEKARREKKKTLFRKQIFKFVAVFSICTCVLTGSLFYTNEQVAYAMAKIPIIGFYIKELADQIYHYDRDGKYADIITPQLNVTENDEKKSDSISQVNQEIKKIAKKQIKDFKKVISKNNAGYLESLLNYDIIEITDGYFTLKLKTYMAMASGQEKNYYYTINSETGRKLMLKDVINNDEKVLKEINDDIISQMKEMMKNNEFKHFRIKGYESEENLGEIFNGINEEHQFYIDKSGQLHIVFDQGEVGPYSMGEVDFTIDRNIIRY